MTMPNIKSTATACCFNGLSNSVAKVNEGWKKRWNMECPGFCFRGADSVDYDLNPGILRPPYPDSSEDLAKLENSLWVDFRLRSKPLLGHHVRGAWEALLIMQQYGFPTRLLDWSQSLAVAAYFAVRDLSKDVDGAVWIMASRHLMEIRGVSDAWRTVIGDPSIETLGLRTGPENLEEFNAQHPVAISPDQLVPRMIVQREIYTLHTFQKYAIETLGEKDCQEHGDACFLHKITIPAHIKAGMRSELSVVAGISEESIFPDIEGFARGFVAEYKNKASREGH